MRLNILQVKFISVRKCSTKQLLVLLDAPFRVFGNIKPYIFQGVFDYDNDDEEHGGYELSVVLFTIITFPLL